MINKRDIYRHEGIHSDYEESQVVVVGVPFDGTTSFRPGARFGPDSIRQDIDGLETYSPYLDRDMIDYRYCDIGNLELPFGNTRKAMDIIQSSIKEVLGDHKKCFAIGGEHLISFPLISAYLVKYPDLHIIHLDAHADLRDDYMGEKLSHATVLRRVYEKMGTGQIWQFGIRSGTKEEFSFGKEKTNLHPFNLRGIEGLVEKIGKSPVYLTLDLDVLDPSVFSGTGTPEPGGVTFNELIDGLKAISGLNIVGADIVELSPHYDASGVSTAVACKLLREILLILAD